MKKLIWILLILPAFSCGIFQKNQIVVTGTVVGSDHHPLPMVFLGIQGNGLKEYQTLRQEKTFRFLLKNPGGYFMWVNGVYHNSIMFPLLVEKTGTIRLQIQMAAATFKESFDTLKVIGDFNDFSDEENFRLMRKQNDGIFSGTISTPADTLAYKVLGALKSGYSAPGTQADYFVRDRHRPMMEGHAGVFISVVRTVDGKATIRFDPASLPHATRAEKVVFDDSTSATAKIVAIHHQMNRRGRRFSCAYHSYVDAGNDPRKFSFDWSKDLADISGQIEKEQNPIVRDYLLLNYFHLSHAKGDSALARRVFKEVAPSSLAWSLEWAGPGNTLYTLSRIANQPHIEENYVEQVVATHPDSSVRAAFLYHELSAKHFAKDTARATKLYQQLISQFGKSRYAEMAKKYYAPNRRIMVGKPVPSFSLPSLEDSTLMISDQHFLGKWYLIDFWATWCGPCVAEMENLHKVYKKYRDRNFTIISLSLDDKEKDIVAFRKRKWPMPWQHVFLQGTQKQEILEKFEVVGIPKPILVDPSGKIAAAPEELRGDNLEKTLARMIHF